MVGAERIVHAVDFQGCDRFTHLLGSAFVRVKELDNVQDAPSARISTYGGKI